MKRTSSRDRVESLSDPQLLRDYPLDVFPNWNINAGDPYYVKAPIDKLGDVAFHIRTHITALILAGNTATIFVQSFSSPGLTKVAFAFSQLGFETFFFVLTVLASWLFDARLGRLLAALLSLCFFVSGSIKVALSLPRPPAPPAKRLSEEDRDWAWPSNHALVGTAFPWYIWLYASGNYDLSFGQSCLLLTVLFTWNVGVAWSRVYLGVHSPCDVLGGWTLGVLILFVFGGFALKLDAAFLAAQTAGDYTWFVALPMLLLAVHPRAWPETQSYGEVVCVLSGTMMIWAGRYFRLGSETPHLSLYESNEAAPGADYMLRMFVGVFFILLGRIIAKRITLAVVAGIYASLGLPYYSYSEMCKRLDSFQPTKRFTPRMRFRAIPGGKPEPPADQIPYDIDLPTKAVVYSFVGFMVAEGCPAIFSLVGI
ncbi:hypothetical protein PENTCL1PPCAC_9614 [Pristionchus entomophagus]|uniref:Phosphatidic acid phosphatase type 2/haloperoxidase domain-containing protein n=1 Tax=Pristionchus entomophagus TaxID=358040 RepID=A0AAV5SWZ4_9BILA|nr:hypothetical protein PENTCL1PPCAC_9614 [Pristionchus entomophagus]